MRAEEHFAVPERPRVSIAERLIPAIGFGMAAIAGIVGAWRMIEFFRALRNSETAGFASLYSGLSEIEGITGGILAFGAVLGLAGLGVCGVRMFLKTRTASPSSLLMAAMGILGLLPPVLVAGSIGMMNDALRHPPAGGIAQVGATIATILLITIAAGVAALPVLLALSLLPFRGAAVETAGSLGLSTDENVAREASGVPKRFATLIVLVLVEVALVALTAWYFGEMFASRQEMTLH